MLDSIVKELTISLKRYFPLPVMALPTDEVLAKANVFADADGEIPGSQALAIDSAALVKAGTSTYLIVNDGAAGFQSANDLVMNLTGITGIIGTLPPVGAIPVASFFE